MLTLRSLAPLVPAVACCLVSCGSAAQSGTLTSASANEPRSSLGDARLKAAIAGPSRTEKERARDVYRHPLETLTFFGLRDNMTVVELWPGGGYYTSILAPVLAESGKLVVTHFDPNGDPKSEDTQEARGLLDRLAKSPDVYARVERVKIAAPDFSFGPDGSADLVVTFRNVHNWVPAGYADRVFAAAFRVLKPGGTLGVEDHRAKAVTMSPKEIDDTGYIPEDTVVSLAAHAGFRLAARSEINANPKDTKDYAKGVWTLPPTFANKEVDHDKYAAIGESDRMTLRFVKP